MSRKIVIVALVAAMVLTLSGLAWADEGDAKPEGQHAGYLKQGIMQQLTPEQREELKVRIGELREEDATPQEIRTAVGEMFKEWGVQPRQLWGAAVARVGMLRQLSPEQREQIQNEIQTLREEEASPQEIQEAVGNMLKEWGIQPGVGQPGQRGMGMMQPGQRGMGMMQQRGQQGPPPQWGQQGPPPQWGQPGPPPQWGQQGPPPQWGQQGPPPQWGQQQQGWRGQQGGYGQQAQRPGWQMMMQRLTPEQREEVRGTVKELHEEGVEPQEIREAVREMLEGWGIQLPPQGRD